MTGIATATGKTIEDSFAMLNYDLRVNAGVPFDYFRVFQCPKTASLIAFRRIIWYGYDEEGPAVYRKNPKTGKVVRIDYYQDLSQNLSQ
ncbi:MAG: hypothetical protein ACQ5SW_09110 [Sphaerochaetaceae bacterium]